MTRGEVYRVRLPSKRGHQQAAARYGIVVRATEFAPLSTVIVVPTSTSARPALFRPEVVLEEGRTRALPEQVLALDLQHFGDFAGRVSPGDLDAVDNALRLVLDLG